MIRGKENAISNPGEIERKRERERYSYEYVTIGQNGLELFVPSTTCERRG